MCKLYFLISPIRYQQICFTVHLILTKNLLKLYENIFSKVLIHTHHICPGPLLKPVRTELLRMFVFKRN